MLLVQRSMKKSAPHKVLRHIKVEVHKPAKLKKNHSSDAVVTVSHMWTVHLFDKSQNRMFSHEVSIRQKKGHSLFIMMDGA